MACRFTVPGICSCAWLIRSSSVASAKVIAFHQAYLCTIWRLPVATSSILAGSSEFLIIVDECFEVYKSEEETRKEWSQYQGITEQSGRSERREVRLLGCCTHVDLLLFLFDCVQRALLSVCAADSGRCVGA